MFLVLRRGGLVRPFICKKSGNLLAFPHFPERFPLRKEQLILNFGKPSKIKKSKNGEKIREQWCYDYVYSYFEDD